jgi:CrcB protein
LNQLVAIAVVAVGGAIGSVVRLLVGTWYVQRFGAGFPWATFGINVVGALLIGVVLQIAQGRADFSPYLRLFLAVGILGGFTTFSTFAYEIVSLSREGLSFASVVYAVGSVVAGTLAVIAGLAIGRIAVSG